MTKATRSFDETYDVVVIGAGLGGLSCGAFLAKGGRRVKVWEKEPAPGGYCTSFERQGFRFGSALLFTNGYGPDGIMTRMLAELGMEGRIKVSKLEPFCRVILPKGSFTIPAGTDIWVSELVKDFPREETGIVSFFSTMRAIAEDMEKLPARSPALLKYQDMTIKEMLDEHLSDAVLKAVISSIFYGNLPPSRFSALNWCHRTRRYLEEGGYRIMGGAEVLTDAFVSALKAFGGQLEVGMGVSRILVADGRAVGVVTNDGRRIKANHVVSNVAARQTFGGLVTHRETEAVAPGLMDRLHRLEITPSAFVIWVGTDLEIKSPETEVMTIVHASSDYEKEYDEATRGNLAGSCFSVTIPTLLDPGLAPPRHHAVTMYMYAPFCLPGSGWNQAVKAKLTGDIIRQAEAVIPGLSGHVVVQESASPRTLERYTLNTYGSPVGWSYATGNVFNRPEPKTPLEGLYLTGHWTSHGGSMKGVAYSGSRVAQMIIDEG